MNRLTGILSALIFLGACQNQSLPETGLLAENGMVVSAHPLASEAGLTMLTQEGNAIDAAIATQFALAVVYPRAGNIGGGGFALIRLEDGTTSSLDFREKAPALSTRDMYLDSLGEVVTNLSILGHKAAGVPGSVAGMWELHQKYGTLPWATLLEPAIKIASEGFRITKDEAEALNEKQEPFKQANLFKPWAINDNGWKAGDLIQQKALAATLERIQSLGKDGFYKGETAELILKEMQRGNGLISLEDLENYEAIWRKPIEGDYKEYKIIGMPPPSSGGVALLQLLQGAEQLGLSKYEFGSKEYINTITEIEKRVFADRSKYLGDPDFYKVPVDTLISPYYNQNRFRAIEADAFTPSNKIEAGNIALIESDETTHFSIVDKEGNAIAVTTTLNHNYGCKVWVEGAGFVLNNEMDDFSAKPGVPNYFGLLGAEANAIAPQKRMVSSMTPTIVEKDGALTLVLGTPGGSTIITSVFQLVIDVLDYDMTMQEAVNQPRFHHQWLPDEIKMEQNAIDSLTQKALTEMGHSFKLTDKIGRTDCILVRADGLLEAGADYTRGDDKATGY